MAINQTLVDAAFKLGKSNVPIIDTGLAKRQAELPGLMLDPIQKALEEKNNEVKKQNEINNKLKDGQIAEFTKVADAITKRLSTYEMGGKEAGMHEQIFNNTFDYLGELKEEYELYNTTGEDDTPENKKKRTEILGRLDAIKNSTVNLRADILSIGSTLGTDAGGKYNKTISDLDLQIGKEILNMDGDYSNVQHYWDRDKKEMMFDVNIDGTVHTWPASELKGKFPDMTSTNSVIANLNTNAASVETAAGKRELVYGTDGTVSAAEFNLQENIDEIREAMGIDERAAGHIFQTRLDGMDPSGWPEPPGGSSGKWNHKDGKGSWANALESHSDLNGAYKLDSEANLEVVANLLGSGELSQEDVQLDEDPNISPVELEAVMSNQINRDKVIDVLVNPNNPLYNHYVSVEEFSTWRANQNKLVHDEYQANKLAKYNLKNPNNSGVLNVGKG